MADGGVVVVWLGYALLLSTLFAAAARGVEAALRTRGRPLRWVWAAALALSLAVPAALAVRTPAPDGAPVTAVAAAAPVVPGAAAELAGPTVRIGAWARSAATWAAPWLLAGWAAASAAALLLLALTHLRLRRRTRRWRPAAVDGEPVLVSRRFGPAVLGVVRPSVVVPEWVLALDARSRRMIVRHEAEHRRARDTLLLAAGALAVAAAPWNPALWWQARRLRMAVELDCDRRVLADPGVSPRAYGRLLLRVGERLGSAGLPAAAMAEPRSFLARRLTVLACPPSRRTPAALGGLALAAAALFAACEAPAPTALRGEAEAPGDGAAVQATFRAVEVAPATAPAGRIVARAKGDEPSAAPRVTATFRELEPLYYVDGVRVENGRQELLDRLDPDAVDRIEVLKGEAARAVYGDEAAGGIVRVYTKRPL